MEIKNLLEVEIREEFEKLSDMELGSEEHKTAVDGLTKLMDKHIEMERSAIERNDKLVTQEIEHENTVKQMKEERTDRIVKNILTGAGIVLPLVVYGAATLVSLKAELIDFNVPSTNASRTGLRKLLEGKK